MRQEDLMMKKNYNIPEVDVITLDEVDVLTVSVVNDEIVVNADEIF